LDITANSTSKTCGQTVTFTGTEFTTGAGELVNGNAVNSVTLTSAGAVTTATVSGSPYAIIAGSALGTGLSNYSITYHNGSLTINAVNSIDASGSSNTYPINTTATLSATISPAVGGVPVKFTVVSGSNVTTTYSAFTNSTGIATYSVSGLGVNLYKVTAEAGTGCAVTLTPAYFTVYDPNAGFVTGGGWIISPIVDASTCSTCIFMRTTGKANFGFNAQYKKGSSAVDGNTQFQFQEGNLNFKSSTYNTGSLVIAGAKAIFKGTGTINGSGNYGFMVSGIDGGLSGTGIDKFRIKIWDISTGNVVYDNNYGVDENGDPATSLGGGSIVIHTANTKSSGSTKAVATTLPMSQPFNVKMFNNPSVGSSEFRLKVESDSREDVQIIVTNMFGEKVLATRGAVNNSYHFGANWRSGTYIIQVIQGKNIKTLKVVKGEG